MEFTLTTTFNVSAATLYNSWLDSAQHSAMTGGEANTSAQVGDEFDAWNGYITGKNLALIPNKRILQSWRTTEFEAGDKDSQVEILLEEIDGQTRLTLIHTNLSEAGEQYKLGWQEHYFAPMKEYFS
jgi:activator of HSP90 ATPase